MTFLEELAARRRFGMKPGLDAMRALTAALDHPERRLRNVVHVAGTNGKGAVCAILDHCLRAAGHTAARYTSPHLVRLNERFFLNGAPLSDRALSDAAARVFEVGRRVRELTFFEALTAVAFDAFAVADPDFTVLETGLGGRLDATNVCVPAVTVITRLGLDHCDWLGDTLEKISAEKAGIIKPGVPVVLGRNMPAAIDVVRARAEQVGAPFHYAPDLVAASEVPTDFSLAGTFNRENACTALAALKVLFPARSIDASAAALKTVVWPGRFQRIGRFLVDGAHNPPAARALAEALASAGLRDMSLICGFCGDKDIDETLRILKPFVSRAWTVRTSNPRALAPDELAAHATGVGIPAVAADSLDAAIRACAQEESPVLVCGSLFLAGEALVALGAYPWPSDRFDASELLTPEVPANSGIVTPSL